MNRSGQIIIVAYQRKPVFERAGGYAREHLINVHPALLGGEGTTGKIDLPNPKGPSICERRLT